MTVYALAFGMSLALSLALTPLARKLACRWGAIVMPHDRKVHERPTPTLGGLAIFASFALAVLACLAFMKLSDRGFPRGMWEALWTPETLGIFVSSLMILALGAWDDLRELSPLTKLAGQIVAVLTMISFGVEIRSVSFIRGSTYDLSGSPLASLLLTLLWMVAFINIINLIDGLDGLAAGVVFISSVAYLIYGSLAERGLSLLQAMLLAASVSGSTLGFLAYNFNPASIFMGDSGALFLGFIMGAVSIQGILKRAAVATLLTPIIILLVPIIDTGMAIYRRLRSRRPVHHADKEHLHHRLLYLGHSQRQAVLLIYLWTVLLTGVALSLEFSSSKLLFLTLLLLTLASLLLIVFPRFIRARRQEEYLRDLEEEAEGLGGENGRSA